MNTVKEKNLVFSRWDDVVFHPENFFDKNDLPCPYHIFTGIGLCCTVQDNFFVPQYFFFKDKKGLDRFLKQLPDDDFTIEECFYAYVIKQNNDDPFKDYIERA